MFTALVNGGFEEGRQDGTPVGWRKVGGEMARTGEVHGEGAFAAEFTSSTTSTKWMYQTVAVEGGAYYEAVAKALKDDPAAAAVFLRLSWYASEDASGQAIGTVDSTEVLETDWPEFRRLTTGPVGAPQEARSAKVRLMLRPASAAVATVYFDEVTFVPAGPPVPAPTGHTRLHG